MDSDDISYPDRFEIPETWPDRKLIQDAKVTVDRDGQIYLPKVGTITVAELKYNQLQFRLLDTYVATNVAGWDLSFGKQSLWWAPNQGGALLFSDNAEPIYMARVSRVAPFELPWVLRWLGPMKWDLFMGKLSGNQYPPRPLIHGEKIGFKPTEHLELSFSRTGEFGGAR